MTEQEQDLDKTENGQLESSATRDAGRALDALVAEKVMGCARVTVNDRGEVYGAPPELIASGDIPKDHGRVRLPHYSEDIAAAWQVVEKLRRERDAWVDITDAFAGWSVTLTLNNEDGTHVHSEGHGGAEEKTLPLAICRAALAAMEAL